MTEDKITDLREVVETVVSWLDPHHSSPMVDSYAARVRASNELRSALDRTPSPSADHSFSGETVKDHQSNRLVNGLLDRGFVVHSDWAEVALRELDARAARVRADAQYIAEVIKERDEALEASKSLAAAKADLTALRAELRRIAYDMTAERDVSDPDLWPAPALVQYAARLRAVTNQPPIGRETK